MTKDELIAWRDKQASLARGERFLGFPLAWLDRPTWLCPNGHASERYLKTERGACCLACQGPVIIGPDISEQEFQQKIAAGEIQ
jgi:hypothetical protein